MLFCYKDETIMHLFFECRFARVVWSIIQAASGLCQPYSVPNIFGTWLSGISKDLKSLALLGTTATVWSIWLYHHDSVFEKKTPSSPSPVIFSVTHWLRC
jgi:hypothetical protein